MYYNYNQYVNLGAFLDKNACTFAIYAKNVSSLILNIDYNCNTYHFLSKNGFFLIVSHYQNFC